MYGWEQARAADISWNLILNLTQSRRNNPKQQHKKWATAEQLELAACSPLKSASDNQRDRLTACFWKVCYPSVCWIEGVTWIAPRVAHIALLLPRERQEGQKFCREISLPIISHATGQLGVSKVDIVYLKIKPKEKRTQEGRSLYVAQHTRGQELRVSHVPPLSCLGTCASWGQTLPQRYRCLKRVSLGALNLHG